nr:GAF domain-containing protein [Neobacillus sp. Marseille-Q6967]
MEFKEKYSSMAEIGKNQAVLEVCNKLMQSIGCDFVALAIQDEAGPDVRWHYAAGNLNDKYERISVRFGKGIAGKVISTGSSFMLEHFPQNIYGKVTDYPIMLAEKLVACYAVPLVFNSTPKGVLLVGKRVPYVFEEEQQEQVNEAGQRLEAVLNHHLTGKRKGDQHGQETS